MNLYQYGEEFDSHILSVTHLLESGLDPDSEEVQTALKYMVNAEGQYEEKALRVGRYIRECLANASVAKIEKERIAKIEKAYSMQADYLKTLLLAQMEQFGKDEIKDETLRIFTKNNPWLVEINNVDNLPEKYQRIVPESKEPDKKALLLDRELLTGETSIKIPGLTFTQKVSLQIK